MKTEHKLIISAASIIAVLFLIALAWGTSNVARQQAADAHDAFCSHWKTNLEDSKDSIKDTWFSDAQRAELSAQINDYNRQCAF